MNQLSLMTAGAVLALLLSACGGDQSVASKSAEAYHDAVREGKEIGTGHDHGGHDAPGAAADIDHAAAAADVHERMDHAATPGAASSSMDHAAMGHVSASGSGAAIDHSAMGHGAASRRGAAVGHSAMSRSATPRSGATTNQSAMGHGTAPPSGAAVDHSAMGHGPAGEPLTAPVTSRQLAATEPGATLAPDSFDAPAPIAVSEANKAAQNITEPGTREIVPGTDRENRPTPQPAFRGGGLAADPGHSQHAAPQRAPADHSRAGTNSGKGAATPASATEYACPMHPEVTSSRPGTCPKCGMALVEKSHAKDE